MRRLVLAVVLTACGRFDFVHARLDAGTDGGTGIDAGADADNSACGATATAPALTVVDTRGDGVLTISAVDVGGAGQLVTVSPGQMLTLDLGYVLADTSCMIECVDQIEIGFSPGDRIGCVFDAAVDPTTGATGFVAMSPFAAPMTPGSYELRTNIGENFSCTANGATTWWPEDGTSPGPASTIVKLCVTP